MAQDDLTASKLLRFSDVAVSWTIAIGAAGLAVLLLVVLS